jgi:ribonuclease G
MSTEILIDTHSWETRVALREDGMVTELYIERPGERGFLGHIYKGKVLRVLPGLEAAFVDIGLEKAAFLYVSDFYDDFDEFDDFIGKDQVSSMGSAGRNEGFPATGNIEGLLRKGQDVLVQVAREPLGGKGARITSHLSLPGRYLVLLPTMDRVGVSRRINDEGERKRLKTIVERIRPMGYGFIVRTAGWDKTEDELKRDMEFLLKLFQSIMEKKDHSMSPRLIHRELDLSLRAVRDLLTDGVDRLLVNSEKEHERLREFADSFLPSQCYKIELYTGSVPISEEYGIDLEIEKVLNKKIDLKSGGTIVIEMTEALTTIDVNTGKFVGHRDLEDTILRTNLEAVHEIARQLRLRNIGGLIIIDFIDMVEAKNRDTVYATMEETLGRDKKKTNISKLSELGIVEMTRKRTRESLTQILTDLCPYCEGRGYVKSVRTVSYEIFRELSHTVQRNTHDTVFVMVSPEVAHFLYDEEREGIEGLENNLGTRIVIRPVESLHIEEYDVSSG